MLCGALVVLMIAGFLMIFLGGQNKWAIIGYGSAGAIVFSLYIVYDTQVRMT